LRLLASLILILISASVNATLYSFEHDQSVWVYDCGQNGIVRYFYSVGSRNTHEIVVSSKMQFSTKLPKKCQPLVDDGYLEHSPKHTSYKTVSMLPYKSDRISVTTAVPMHGDLLTTKGVWSQLVDLEACLSEIGPVLVVGGVIWDQRPSDDYFFKSHNIATPDFFWKLIVSENLNSYQAYLVPNSSKSNAELQKFEVSYLRLKELLQRRVPIVDELLKGLNPDKEWSQCA